MNDASHPQMTKLEPGTWQDVINRPRVHILLILLPGLLAYSNTFGVPFVFDDLYFLENLRAMKLSAILSFFAGFEGYWASRPLLHATLALNHHMGGLDPRGYHVFNLSLHLANGMLLYFLVVMTGRHMRFGERESRMTAVLASLVFVLHPVQTEAVTNIINRSMLLVTAFYLSGLILFLKAATSQRHGGLYTAGLLVVSLLGAASRENFLTFPAMLLLYDLFFISRFRLAGAMRHWRPYLPALLALGYLGYLVLNHNYGAGISPAGRRGIPPADYLITGFNVFWTYLRLLVLPVNQNLDYGYPTAQTLFELPTMLAFLGYLGLWAGSILLARKRPVATFPVLWFLITLLPVSVVVAFLDVALGDVIFEHRLYLPSAGFAVLAALAFARLLGHGRALVAASAVLALTLGSAAYARNSLWTDAVTLWSDAISKSPENPRAYNNIALYYLNAGNPGMAIELLEKAIRMRPDRADYYVNLGSAYLEKGLPGRAEEQLKKSIALAPDFPAARFTLGIVYIKLSEPQRALEQFLKAIELAPARHAYYNKAAEAAYALGDSDKAIDHFEASLRLMPGQLNVHNNLAIIHMEKGNDEKAIHHLKETLRITPRHVPAHNAIGELYLKTGRAEEAIIYFQAALKTNPNIARVHRNLAAAYREAGDADRAEEHLRIARELEAE